MATRGMYTTVTEIRRRVFTEVARLSYEGNDYAKELPRLPYKIVPGEIGLHRNNIFLERAIVSERIRLAIGLPLRPLDEQAPVSAGIENSIITSKYYDPPLINIIKFACNACPEKLVRVTDMCRGCLAHPCVEVCPKDALSFRPGGRTKVDQDKCIKCGKCVEVCPYHAIVKSERPCAAACGMNAITSDSLGRAKIDQDKCVSCGMCLVSCPFGAIVDKGQIFQLVQSLRNGEKVIAIVAPAFISQFPGLTPNKVKAAMRELGFADTVEVAIGADLCTIEEAKDFLNEVPYKIPFMATSCCPSWSVMAKKMFPGMADNISMAMTPMVLTARLLKKRHEGEDIKICFVGPCAAKKLEASRRTIRSHVDFVVTFEELMGMFEAREVDFETLEPLPGDELNAGTAAGRGFATSGGVAQAVVDAIHSYNPDMEIKVASAQGLADCKKLLMMARAGKYDGYLLEGMACPGGCMGGAGTLAEPAKAIAALKKYTAEADVKNAVDTPYKADLSFLEAEKMNK